MVERNPKSNTHVSHSAQTEKAWSVESPGACLMTEADMGLCSESSGRRWLVWERWVSPIFDINSRETKKEKYQWPTLIHGGLGFYETNERCSHRWWVLGWYLPPLRRWGYTRVQHGQQLPINQVEMIRFHDYHKGLQFPGASSCGRIQAILACLPNV